MAADIIEYKGHNDRRERIATAALQGLLANAVFADGIKAPGYAASALRCADALIAALDEEIADE